ncbi:MAG: hypothetical protein J6J12_01870 [Oscillospiraceae bacterium]|nr:hypothetical protein [Oscillospiraceae bacterium]
MKKLLYIAPAFIVCMFVGTIGLLFGFGGFNPTAWAYLACSMAGSALLCMGRPWGGLIGAVTGGIIIWERLENSAGMVMDTMPIGVAFAAYYLIMALVCLKSRKTPDT